MAKPHHFGSGVRRGQLENFERNVDTGKCALRPFGAEAAEGEYSINDADLESVDLRDPQIAWGVMPAFPLHKEYPIFNERELNRLHEHDWTWAWGTAAEAYGRRIVLGLWVYQ